MISKVIAGVHKGRTLINSGERVYVSLSMFKTLELSKTNVKTYEIITEEHRKSAKSGVARGLVGGVLLGPVGALAGGISAKSKGKYQLAVEFRNGDKDLIEVDDKMYKLIMKALF